MSYKKSFSFVIRISILVVFLTITGVVPAYAGSAPPVLQVKPTSLTQTSTQCHFDGPPNNTFHCLVTLGETVKSNGAIQWSSSSSLSGVQFAPASGTLNPGQSSQVMIAAIPCSVRGASGSFTFTGQSGVKPVSIAWSCTLPPTLTVSPTKLNSSNTTNCALDAIMSATYKCTVTLGETSSSQLNANWSVTTHLKGVTFTPSSGNLSPGGSVSVTIDAIPCQGGSFIFSAKEGEIPVTLAWSCTPQTLAVNPTSLNQNSTNCSASGSTYQCTVSLSESSTSKGNVNWAASSNLNGISFSPSSGTLSPGGSTTVTISSIPCQSGTFTFNGSGGAHATSVAWNCTLPPTLTVSPTTLDPTNTTNCALDSTMSATYKCTVTLGETSSSQLNANWTASSGLSGVTFTPANGVLSPGGSASVTIDAIPCQSGSFTFSGNEGETPVSVPWSCTPPTLTVTPTTLNNGMCGGSQNASACTVTLSEASNSQGNVNWASSSDLSSASFNPATGTLAPGQSTTVVISSIPCQGGSFTFNGSGGASPVSVSWTCANWSTLGYDTQNTRYNPLENGLSASNVSGLVVNWQHNLGVYGNSSPIVVNNMAYILDGNGFLDALDINNGSLLWHYYVSPAASVSPAVANGIIYVGGSNYIGGLFAINASTGAVLWHVGSSPTFTPTITNGVVYVGINDGNNGSLSMNAFDANSGTLLWSNAGKGSYYVPAVDNGIVFSGATDGNLYAMDATTGALKWNYNPAPGRYAINSSPTVGNGEVYIVAYNGLAALYEMTGAVLWETGPYTANSSSVAFANGSVYAVMGSYPTTVQALDPTTGVSKWSFNAGNYVGSSSAPTVANGVVYGGFDNHNIYALDASNGAQLWSYTAGLYVRSSPTVVNGALYIGSDDGNLYAFHLPGTNAKPKTKRR